MRRFVTGQLASLLVNIVVSLGVVAGLLVWQQGFGAGDTAAFLFWTLPLAVGVAVVGPPLLSLGRRLPTGAGWLPEVAATVLLTVGWVLLVAQLLGPWMAAFSFSVLYPWLAGVAAQLWWLRRFGPLPAGNFGLRYWLASLGGVVGGVVLLGGGFFLYDYLSRPTPETYLIPAGFRGTFRVVYGVPGGLVPRLENGRRLLPLTSSGVLVIQPPYAAGRLDHTYYLLDGTGRRHELTHQATVPAQPDVAFQRTVVTGGPMPDGAYSSESPLAITYTEFSVSDPQAQPLPDSLQEREQRRLDSLTARAVRRCRARSGASPRPR